MENKLYEVINLKLQAHKTPVFKEEKQKEWIIYGADREGGYYNNYPAYLLYLYNRSSKHNSFINGKVLYICGAGVGFDSDQAYLAWEQAHPQRAPALAELIGQLSQLDCQFHCWTDLTAAVDARQEPLSTYQRPQGLMRI